MNYLKMGLLSNYMINYSFSEYNYLLEKLSQEYKHTYAEGIFGTAKNIIGGTFNTAKGAVKIGSDVVKTLWRLILKIVKAIVSLVKNTINRIMYASTNLSGTLKGVQKLKNSLNNIDDATKNKLYETDQSYNAITVRTMNGAGWNLGADIKPKSKEPNTLAKYMSIISKMADNNYENFTYLDNVQKVPDLYLALNKLFIDAFKIYLQDPDFAELVGWGKVTSKIANSYGNYVNNKNNTKIFYDKIVNPVNYAKYVSQAFSPSGAFVVTSITDTTKKINNKQILIKRVSPVRELNIPANKVIEEFQKNCKYLEALLNYLTKSEILKILNMKQKRANSLMNRVIRLSRLTAEEVSELKNREKTKIKNYNTETSGGDVQYQGDTNNNSNNNEQPSSNNGEGIIPTSLLGVLEDLKAFKEEDINFEKGFDNAQATQNNNIDPNNPPGVKATTQNKTVDNEHGGMNIKETDVNGEMVNKGLNYVKELMSQTGSLSFQEGQFIITVFNVINDTVKNFLKTGDQLLKNLSLLNQDNKSENTNQERKEENYNDNNDENSNSDDEKSK